MRFICFTTKYYTKDNEKMRLRTQTHSLVSNEQGTYSNRPPLSPIIASGLMSSGIPGTGALGKVGPISSSSPRAHDPLSREYAAYHYLLEKKASWGSVTLPVYVYECTSSAVVNNLIKWSPKDDTNSNVCVTLNALFDKDYLDAEENNTVATAVHPKSEEIGIV